MCNFLHIMYMTRKQLFKEAQESLGPFISEPFDFEGCFFWNLYNISLIEYLPEEIYNKINNLGGFLKWLDKYSSLYKDYYSIYRDDNPNFFCDLKQIQEIYFWRAQWIYHSLAKWDFYSNSHFIINDFSIQLYTNLNSVQELKDYIKRFAIDIESKIQIKHYAMWIQLYNLINYQLQIDANPFTKHN